MRETAVEPIVPPAPPRLSMITATPSAADSLSAMARANTSFEPPGGNGTTNVMLRLGQGCAWGFPPMTAGIAAPVWARKRRRFISGLPAFAALRRWSGFTAIDGHLRAHERVDLGVAIAE